MSVHKRVLVIGDAMMDTYIYGTLRPYSSEGPFPLVHWERHVNCPGGAANVACAIDAQGVPAGLIWGAREDENCLSLKVILNELGIWHHHVKVPWRLPIKTRIVCQNRTILRLDDESSPPKDQGNFVAREFVKNVFEPIAREVSWLVISDYDKGFLNTVFIKDLIDTAHHYGISVLVDPKSIGWDKYEHAYCLTPNFHEAVNAYGEIDDSSDMRLLHEDNDEHCIHMARELVRYYELNNLLITRGRHGAYLKQSGESEGTFYRCEPVELADPTGAGDTVIATLAASLHHGLTLDAAAQRAVMAGSESVRHHGTYRVTTNDFEKHREPSHKIVDPKLAKDLIATQKKSGKAVALANGCFDLLHPGHIRLLQAAAEAGTFVIAAINDDDSVRRLKGQDRPRIILRDRMNMLAALGCVDLVCSFSDDTPERLIRYLSPDILVKGDEYLNSKVPGAGWVTSHGGTMLFVPMTEYRSSALGKLLE